MPATDRDRTAAGEIIALSIVERFRDASGATEVEPQIPQAGNGMSPLPACGIVYRCYTRMGLFTLPGVMTANERRSIVGGGNTPNPKLTLAPVAMPLFVIPKNESIGLYNGLVDGGIGGSSSGGSAISDI